MDKPYYQDEWLKHYCGDCLNILPELPDNSVDLLATDPPYGISFMGKDWDKALPDIKVWKECYRVLKAGSFAFVMSIPRADCLSRMIISLEDAGFWVNFTPIFWCFASGFPKAQNIGKAVDKKLGAEGEVVGESEWSKRFKCGISTSDSNEGWKRPAHTQEENQRPITNPTTPQAKALDGSYGGFQPKPAVEVIIVAMKPLSEKTFVDQALKNGKGITWLDDCRIPYESEKEISVVSNRSGGEELISGWQYGEREGARFQPNNTGRFPANLLVSDDVLNDGRVSKSAGKYNIEKQMNGGCFGGGLETNYYAGDSGSFSRYFDLDKWWAKTFPFLFLIVPKASKSEKNKGLGDLPDRETRRYGDRGQGKLPQQTPQKTIIDKNSHPTVKPLKLMSYLITLGSREGDTVLDPYSGSGTTLLACQLLNRKCIGIEIEEKYCEIAAKRCSQGVFDLASVTKKGVKMCDALEPHELKFWRPKNWDYGSREKEDGANTILRAIKESDEIIVLTGGEHTGMGGWRLIFVPEE